MDVQGREGEGNSLGRSTYGPVPDNEFAGVNPTPFARIAVPYLPVGRITEKEIR